MCSITGRLTTGTIGFGIAYVIGRSRVPSPAASTIALMRCGGGSGSRIPTGAKDTLPAR